MKCYCFLIFKAIILLDMCKLWILHSTALSCRDKQTIKTGSSNFLQISNANKKQWHCRKCWCFKHLKPYVSALPITSRQKNTIRFDQLVFLSICYFKIITILSSLFLGGGGAYSHIVEWGCAAWFAKVLPFTKDQILWPSTRPKMLNFSWFQSFVSDPIKRDPILDQMAWKPYPLQRHIPV